MEKENIIEVLEDFIDFLKENENKKEKEVEVVVTKDNDDTDFNNAIDKIAKGE